MRAEEVIVSDKQSSKASSSIFGFESSGSSYMELIGTIKTFDKLFKRPEEFGFRV